MAETVDERLYIGAKGWKFPIQFDPVRGYSQRRTSPFKSSVTRAMRKNPQWRSR